ncbi:MAG: hypothetical protein M1453_09245 [Acidobacteria bacterium]|nr:hypothetical protein [Acidobacteriota bacterium]
MQKPEGLAKAASMIGVVAALATMLAVNANPPVAPKTNKHTARLEEIPAPPIAPQGGVGAAQERGTTVERREAGDGRAPKQSPGSEQ